MESIRYVSLLNSCVSQGAPESGKDFLAQSSAWGYLP